MSPLNPFCKRAVLRHIISFPSKPSYSRYRPSPAHSHTHRMGGRSETSLTHHISAKLNFSLPSSLMKNAPNGDSPSPPVSAMPVELKPLPVTWRMAGLGALHVTRRPSAFAAVSTVIAPPSPPICPFGNRTVPLGIAYRSFLLRRGSAADKTRSDGGRIEVSNVCHKYVYVYWKDAIARQPDPTQSR